MTRWPRPPPPAEGAIEELLASSLERGIGIHNADLSWEERDIIERYVHEGEIRVLCTTTTPAVGMNLPMKNTVIDPRKLHFDPKTRNLARTSIAVSDFENMGGRVGRFRYIDDFGRGILVTGYYVDFKALYGRYVHNPIASGACQSAREIKRLLKSIFPAYLPLPISFHSCTKRILPPPRTWSF